MMKAQGHGAKMKKNNNPGDVSVTSKHANQIKVNKPVVTTAQP